MDHGHSVFGGFYAPLAVFVLVAADFVRFDRRRSVVLGFAAAPCSPYPLEPVEPSAVESSAAALVLVLTQPAKANAAAQAQRNQQTILTVVPRIQQLAALAKAQRAAQAAPAPAGRVAQRSEIAGRLRPRKRAKSSRRAPTVPEKPVSHAPSSPSRWFRADFECFTSFASSKVADTPRRCSQR